MVERGKAMKSWVRILAVCALGLFLASTSSADTLELKDGRVLQGRYLGGTQAVLRFEVNGEVQTFNVSTIVAVTFTGGTGAAKAPTASATPDASAPADNAPAASAPASADAAPPPNSGLDAGQAPVTSKDVAPSPSGTPASATPSSPAAPVAPVTPADSAPAAKTAVPAASGQDPAAQYGEVTLPAGQSLLVRMIDAVDSSKNHVGDIFHATLETDLYLRNSLVARKGTDVYGRLAQAQEAGHFSGSAELQLELMRIVIDGRDYTLVSSDYSLKGQGRGADTAKKVGGGAVFGAILGAIAGGGRGAAIGAGAGSAAGAGVQVLTRGQQVKVPSEALLEFRLQQPAMVTPVQS